MQFILCYILNFVWCRVLLFSWEKSSTDTKQVYTKCEYFPGILEVAMMHLELCESILHLWNFW